MLSRTRCHIRFPYIINTHCHFVITRPHSFSHIDREAGISSDMASHLLSVYIDFSFLKNTVELNESTFLQVIFRQPKTLAIPSIPHIKIFRHKIRNTERMRHSHRFPTRIIIPDSFGSPYISVCIFPFTIKVDLLPWRFRLLCFYHTAKEADTKSK